MPKVICISDTHGGHAGLNKLPAGDLLIHAGDCTSDGSMGALRDFLIWFESQPCPEKVLVAGNHDWCFERHPIEAVNAVHKFAPSVRYLQDHGELIAGLGIWGSPVTPAFNSWAFNRDRGLDIKKHWDAMPVKLDIVVTHGPANGILDKARNKGEHLGCEQLSKCLEKVKPRIHVCGHIHGGYGLHAKDGTLFINASLMNEDMELLNKPVIVNL